MCSLTITDAAYSRIQRELAGSPIESPIISLVQSARATPTGTKATHPTSEKAAAAIRTREVLTA